MQYIKYIYIKCNEELVFFATLISTDLVSFKKLTLLKMNLLKVKTLNNISFYNLNSIIYALHSVPCNCTIDNTSKVYKTSVEC